MFYEIIITILFRGIPEGFIYIFAMYTLSNVKIDKNKCILSSVILSILMVAIRELPISYGVHTILVMMTIILLGVIINKLEMIYCISIAIVIMIVQFLAEGLNIFLIKLVFRKDVATVLSTPISKVIYGIPSLIIAFVGINILGKLWKRQMIKRA